jgi:hypothetical protein
MGSVNP